MGRDCTEYSVCGRSVCVMGMVYVCVWCDMVWFIVFGVYYACFAYGYDMRACLFYLCVCMYVVCSVLCSVCSV